MPVEFKPGCQRPAIAKPTIEIAPLGLDIRKEQPAMVQVGKPAPEFTAAGFHNGKFANFSLSEFKGKWVLVCFYPGDFTFV
ncbi:MAG: redoxin domain-containing protein [Chloroflexi bacterium]|nr:redoxin domain-containing protein [Chloroflexota bacterium]